MRLTTLYSALSYQKTRKTHNTTPGPSRNLAPLLPQQPLSYCCVLSNPSPPLMGHPPAVHTVRGHVLCAELMAARPVVKVTHYLDLAGNTNPLHRHLAHHTLAKLSTLLQHSLQQQGTHSSGTRSALQAETPFDFNTAKQPLCAAPMHGKCGQPLCQVTCTGCWVCQVRTSTHNVSYH